MWELRAAPRDSELSSNRGVCQQAKQCQILPPLPLREPVNGGVKVLKAQVAQASTSESEDVHALEAPGTPQAFGSRTAKSSVLKDLTPASKLVRLSIAAAELDLSAREPRLVDCATGMLHLLPNDGVVALGRRSGCEIPVQSVAADARHCVLVCSCGTVTVEDVSETGTAVNDTPLPKGDFLPQPLRLQRGDVLTLAPPAGPSFLFLDAACS